MSAEIVGSVAKMLARAGPILARLPKDRDVTMIEVGVSSGIMAEHLLANHPNLVWHGIDPWAPPHQQRAPYIASGDVHARITFDQTLHCMDIALRRLRPFGGRAVVHRDWSPEAAEGFASGSVDLVFEDSDHSYEGTLASLRAWWRVVRPGGFLGGHDINHTDPRFRFGVDRAAAEFGQEIGIPFELDDGLTYWFAKP